MEKILSANDRFLLNHLVSETERHTNTQIVLAVIKRSDSYAEIPWKAFALGASITGLLFVIINFITYSWVSYTTVIMAITITLIAGATLALLTTFIPPFARLFLSEHRSEVEVKQYAESLFLSNELFATGNRTGVLILVSLFEHEVILLPDKGLNNYLTEGVLTKVISSMTIFLKKKQIVGAFEEGLKQLSLILEDSEHKKQSGKNKNELPNQVIEEEGI